MDFGGISLGSTSAPQTVQFQVRTGSTVNVSSVSALADGSPNLDYGIASNSCSGTLVGPANCAVQVSFAPTQRGLRRGALVVSESGATPTQSIVFLGGVGVGSQLVFSPDTVNVMATVAPLQPTLYAPTTLALDGAGDLIFNDTLHARVLERSTAATLSELFAQAGNTAQMLALDGAGRIFVCVPQSGEVVVWSGSGAPAPIAFSGAAVSAPAGIAIDGAGNLYVADSATNQIVRAKTDGSAAAAFALTGLAKPLAQPRGLAIDATYLYIVDSGNDRLVRVVLATGAATALSLTGAQPYNAYGVAVDASGSIYVADTGNHRLLRILPTLASTAINTPTFSFSSPTGIVVDYNGDLLVADNNSGIVRVVRATPSSPLTFRTPTPAGELDSADGAQFVTLQNIGNTALDLVVPTGSATNPATTNAAFSIATASTCPVLNATSSQTFGQLAVADSCTYGVDFTPAGVGAATGDLVIQSLPTGAASAQQAMVPLAGTGAQPADNLSISVAPAPAAVGNPAAITLKLTLQGQPAVNYRGTVTLSSTDTSATFPSGSTYTFTAADAGTHIFSPGIDFGKAGTFAVAATDGTLRASLNVVVQNAQAATAVTLTSSSPTVFATDPATLSATVAATSGTAIPSGTVTFFNGSVAIANATLDAGGHASTIVSFTSAGTETLSVRYNGGSGFAAATSAPLIETVGDFSVLVKAGTASAASGLPGSTVSFAVTVAPVALATLAGPVTLSVAGLPAGAIATFTPATVPQGAGATDAALQVALSNVQSALLQRPGLRHGGARNGSGFSLGGLGVLAALALPLFFKKASRTRRTAWTQLALLLYAAAGAATLSGCLSNTQNGYYGNTPQTFHVTITAASGTLTHSTGVDLTVQ